MTNSGSKSSSNNGNSGKGLLTVDTDNGDVERNGGTVETTAKALPMAEIIEKYREAVLHYGKYRFAGVVETEASIKAVQVSLVKLLKGFLELNKKDKLAISA